MRLWVVSFWLWVGISANLLACPCGCGSVGQLTLFPGETWKWQIQANRDFLGRSFEPSGKVGIDDGPSFSDSIQWSVARALSDDISLSLSVPFERNSHAGGQNDANFSDPSIGVLMTVLRHNFASPQFPQLDLGLSYKHPFGKNTEQGIASSHLVDIHSNGWAEWATSANFTWDFFDWVAAINQTVIFRADREIQYGPQSLTRRSPPGFRTALSFGYTFLTVGQIIATISHEEFGEQRVDGQVVKDSQVKKNSLGVLGQLRVGHKKAVTLSLTQNGAFGRNQNTPFSNSVAFSYVQAI